MGDRFPNCEKVTVNGKETVCSIHVVVLNKRKEHKAGTCQLGRDGRRKQRSMCVHTYKNAHIKKYIKEQRNQTLTVEKDKTCEVVKWSELKMGDLTGRENCLPKSLRDDLVSQRAVENAKLILHM